MAMQDAHERLLDLEILESLASLGKAHGQTLLQQLFDLFCAQGPASLVVLRRALEARDVIEIRETAHSLKGSYKSLGTVRLATLSEQLEEAALEADWAACEPLIDGLEIEFSQTREVLGNFVRSHV